MRHLQKYIDGAYIRVGLLFSILLVGFVGITGVLLATETGRHPVARNAARSVLSTPTSRTIGQDGGVAKTALPIILKSPSSAEETPGSKTEAMRRLILRARIHAARASLAVSPLPTPTPLSPAAATTGTVRVPILMYHYLSVPPEDADMVRQDLSVSPALFAAHLDRLRAAGYTTIDLDLLVRHFAEGASLPEKPVIITFDDGYRDNYTSAFPLLAARGMTATFFVVTDFIDHQLPTYLTWEMVREMHAGGMTIGSHGRDHQSLKNQDVDFLVWQALGSAETIEYELGERPRFVSYPAGEYDPLTIDIFRSAHYQAAVTTVQGTTHSADNLFELKRVRVRNITSPDELIRLVSYDW